MPDGILTPEELARDILPKDLRRLLTVLQRAGSDAETVELTLGACPLGTRLYLETYEIIGQKPRRADDDPVEVVLTPFGRQVMLACNNIVLTAEDQEKLAESLRNLEEARAQRQRESAEGDKPIA